MSGPVKTMPVSLEAWKCKGCGACADLLPEVFGWDEIAEKAFLKQSDAPEEAARQCAVLCPSRCIEVPEE